MTLDRLNPAGLFRPKSFPHPQVVVATGSKMVFLSGQVARDSDGNVVGEGDVVAQARQAFRNLATALAAAGATVADVAQITWYVVNYSEALFPALIAARGEVFGDYAPAGTLVGVQALGERELLTEVDAIAVLD